MTAFAETLQGYVMAATAVMFGGALAWLFGVLCMRAWRRFTHAPHCVALAAAGAICLYIGATKPVVEVSWDWGFASPRGVEVDTNDTRLVTFSWSVADGVPSFAKARLSAVDRSDASEGMTLVAEVPMSDCGLSALMEPAATNYLYFMECSYIPDAGVVTNGVYHVRCVGGRNVWIPIGLEIHARGEAISPPEGMAEYGEHYIEWLEWMAEERAKGAAESAGEGPDNATEGEE